MVYGDEITTIWRNVVQTFQADLAIIGAGGADFVLQ